MVNKLKTSLAVIKLISLLGPRGVLPIMARTERLRLKGVPFSVFWYSS